MDFNAALNRLRPLLVARAARMRGTRQFGAGAPEPEDLAQMAMLKLTDPKVRDRLEPQGEEALRKFAFRTLSNTFIDACARKKREVLWRKTGGDEDEGGPPEPEDEGLSPEGDLLFDEFVQKRKDAVAFALGSLEEQERTFLVKVFETGSAPEAQRALGWPPGSAANACKRRNTLIKKLQKLAEERPMLEAREVAS